MFGRQSGLVSSSGGSGQSLIEFRAGRLNMVGKMLHPDTRKGLVYLTQSEDGLIHFCWKDRVSGKVDDDLIVFPDDFEFKRIEQCKTGRAYVLKFKTSSRRLFFWMQEPKTDKDEEFCRRVNEIMNNPPSVSRNATEGGDLQYMLNNMSQQQLMQLFGGVGQMGGLSSLLGPMNRSLDNFSSRTSNSSSTSRTAVTTDSTSTPENTSSVPRVPSAPVKAQKKSGTSRVTSSELQSYLSALTTDPSTAKYEVDLSTVISNSKAVNDIIADQEKAQQLAAHLPITGTNDSQSKQLKDTIASPQFQQALSLFCSALQSGQMGPIAASFQMGDEVVGAANTGDMEQFIKALEKTTKKSDPQETKPE